MSDISKEFQWVIPPCLHVELYDSTFSLWLYLYITIKEYVHKFLNSLNVAYSSLAFQSITEAQWSFTFAVVLGTWSLKHCTSMGNLMVLKGHYSLIMTKV